MNKSLSLYEISNELKPLEDALEQVFGDPDALAPELIERVTELLTASQAKADAYGYYAKSIEATISAIRDEQERLSERRRMFENRLRRLKDAADRAMVARGITKIEGELHTISRVKNGGKRAMRLLVEPTELPGIYQVPIIEANAIRLRNDAEAGDQEALKYVEFDEPGYSVRIK